MDNRDAMIVFLERIATDPYVDTKHIAVYSALYLRWQRANKKPVRVKSRTLMKEAKISSSATYFLKLRHLVDKGYIKYYPSRNTKSSSSFFLE
ncbi:hypothetical protein [Sphingobacterium yanglingense]|uniref:Ferric uptake regulator family protein n=1 Tax=Sphingobacterium yanglingense TaxID=1437280 RepID=A0A4R6W9D3_9SPHI|nr:hypothetical protein [Sphingobacterium yanglingense]TDQ73799.1 hypothetical protein CLV99_4236 [Sphingobacterium yanglingense]